MFGLDALCRRRLDSTAAGRTLAVFSLGQWSVSVCSCVPAMVHNNIVCLLCYTGIHAAPKVPDSLRQRYMQDFYCGSCTVCAYCICGCALFLSGCGSLSTDMRPHCKFCSTFLDLILTSFGLNRHLGFYYAHYVSAGQRICRLARMPHCELQYH